MKKPMCLMMLLSFVLSFGYSAVSYAEDVSNVKADHLSLAASYEEKAAAQDALIAEHQKMKGDFRRRFFINEKVTPMAKIITMEKHCDVIIRDAQKLRDELREFAKWHQMRAAELEGK